MFVDHIKDKGVIDTLLLSILSDTNNLNCDLAMLLTELIPFIAIERSPESIKFEKVKEELDILYGHPICGDDCKFKPKVSRWRPTLLVRQTHNTCSLCDNAVSEYDHRVCHHHADIDEYPLEFDYHHLRCRKRTPPRSQRAF